MTPEQEARIRAAAIEAANAEVAFEAAFMMNIADTYEGRQKQKIEYALAKARAFEAKNKLCKAIES